MPNKCTSCDYQVGPNALFCRGCGSVTTRDPDAKKEPKPPTKRQVTRQKNLEWAARMDRYHKLKASRIKSQCYAQ